MSASAPPATLWVNDRPQALLPGATVRDVLLGLGLAERKGVAAALNGAVLPRSEWAGRNLAADDRVLVIQATQGG